MEKGKCGRVCNKGAHLICHLDARFGSGSRFNGKFVIVKTASSQIYPDQDSRPTTPVDQSTPTLTLCPVPLPPGIILTELKEAKSNLYKTTKDLTMIRASVESLNKKLRTHKSNFAEKDGETKWVIEESVDITNGFCKLTFEGQQFRRMEEAAQYEVIKATSEIENTKLSIKMVDMRLIAAKKMEEAARAMEAVARAENEDKPLIRDGKTLSYEEYSVLAQKAQKTQKAEEIFKKNDGNEFPYRQKTLEEALGNTRKNDLGLGPKRGWNRKNAD
ncbi:hypothetical protein LXL04_014013 [Taraxacum kok-saghyz]